MLSTCLCRGYTERNLKTIISCRNEPSIYSLRRKGRFESFAVPAGPFLCIMGFASVINTWGLLPPALSAGTCCSEFSGQPCSPQEVFTLGLKIRYSSTFWQRHVEGGWVRIPRLGAGVCKKQTLGQCTRGNKDTSHWALLNEFFHGLTPCPYNKWAS